MNPNVHALNRARTSLSAAQRPDRAEVESAVRTIIRWTGEDPDRDGLRETPARVTRSLEEFFAVGAEAFFVAPEDLEREEPDLYRLLAEFFRQDPARDKRNGGREAPVAAERSDG